MFQCFNAALLAGFISRQTRAGAALDQQGYIMCPNTNDDRCQGIMGMKDGMYYKIIHIPYLMVFHLSNGFFSLHLDIHMENFDGIGGIDYLEAGIDQLIALIDDIVARHSAWSIVQLTRGGIAAWEIGLDKIYRFNR